MSIAIFFEGKDSDSWAAALTKRLPDTPIEIHPEITHPEAVQMAACWRPPAHSLEQLPNLQLIQSIGAGINHITNTQQLGNGVRLCRFVDEHLSHDIFEYVLGGILGHLRNLKPPVNKLWKPESYKRLSDISVAILGLGAIGEHIATQLARLGARVKGWSRSKKELEGVATYFGKEGLSEALQGTDILVSVLPLTIETTDLINRDLMAQLNLGAFVINVGRGHHLVDNDLVSLIEEKHLSGALLDVFRKEPLPQDHPFWRMPEVLITPHIAAITDPDRAIDLIVDNWNRLQKREPLKHEVDLKRGY